MILLTSAKMPEGLDKNTLASAVSLMFPSPENRDFIERMREKTLESSACESLFALTLLYEQIRDLPQTHGDTKDLVFLRNPMGKPYFKDSDIRFNVSHSKGFVVCAAAVGEELGVDVEASLITPERAERLSKRYFSEEEQTEISKHPEIFARKWTEKEARAKFSGESIEKILSQDKISPFSEIKSSIRLHRYTFEEHPVTLCTKRDFSTIIYTVQ